MSDRNPKVITHAPITSELPAKVKRIEIYDERRGWGYKHITLREPMTTHSQVTTITRNGVIRLYGPQGY